MKSKNIYFVLSALATLKPQAGITAGAYIAPAPQPVSLTVLNQNDIQILEIILQL